MKARNGLIQEAQIPLKHNHGTIQMTRRTHSHFVYITRALYCILAFIFMSLSISSYASNSDKTTLRVAIAANFSPIAKQLIPEFTKESGINVEVISGASGALFQQIKHGAPYDMFLSADAIRPKALKDNYLIVENSLATYAIGKLAFWSATHVINNTHSLPEVINRFPRLAMPNPDIAPYGYSAKQVLVNFGLWTEFKKKLITGINVNQTFQQIRSKAVQGGFVALSQLKLNKLSGLEIPQQYYSPIKQQLVILKRSSNQGAAHQFAAFLYRKKTQQKIASFGYTAIMPTTDNKPCCEMTTKTVLN